MITETEYLEALKIVKLYYKQLSHFIHFGEENVEKTPIEVWLSSLKNKPSTRLIKALLENKHYDDGKPFKYLEDISKNEFRRLRNVGDGTWKEFLTLKSN